MESRSAPRSWASSHKGKLKRQLAILDATREIIMQSGAAALNMREVASRAGVSIATPYNLFESKSAILAAIYENEQADFIERFDRKSSSDPLLKAFEAIDYTFEFYGANPGFYKEIIRFPDDSASPEIKQRVWNAQSEFFRDLFSRAIDCGDLAPDAPIDLISSFFTKTFIVLCLEWLQASETLEFARTSAHGGLRLLLTGSLTTKGHIKMELV